MPRWSELSRPDLEFELAKLGLTPDDLICDVQDVPELRARCELLDTAGLLRLALEHFGDEGHPQPVDRTDWVDGIFVGGPADRTRRTPEWGSLPPRGDGPTPVVEAERPSLPNPTQLKLYTHASIEKAVKGFTEDGTRGDVERDAKFPPQDARRVRLMLSAELFRLNAKNKLIVDERVARKSAKYALRYLDDSGTRWLDPNVELRGR